MQFGTSAMSVCVLAGLVLSGSSENLRADQPPAPRFISFDRVDAPRVTSPSTADQSRDASAPQTVAGVILPGDCNGNDRIDRQDHELYVLCAEGPNAKLPDVDCACTDADGDGDADMRDWRVLAVQFQGAPADNDNDGVLDEVDPCGGSMQGAESIIAGCTNLDLARMPATLLQPTHELIGFLLDVPLGDEALAEERALVVSGRDKLEDAAAMVRAGQLCESLPLFNGSAQDLTVAAELIDEAKQMEEQLLTDPADVQDDVRPIELRIGELELFVQRGVESFVQVQELWSAVNQLCINSRSLERRPGVIAEVLDESGHLRLEDETLVKMAVPVELETTLFPGRAVLLTGIDFGDRTGVVTRIEVDKVLTDPTPVKFSCLRTRFFPVQQFVQQNVHELIRHDPRGYELNNRYRVEIGMRVGVENVCDPVVVVPGETFTRYSASIVVVYTPSHNSNLVWGEPIASDLDSFDKPVALPGNMDPDFPATLIVRHRTQQCLATRTGPDCFEEPGEVLAQEFDLDVFNRRGLCFASYADTEFDVNDFILHDFRSTFVTGMTVLAVWDDGTEPEFHAEGYSAQLLEGGVTTSYPIVVPIVGGQEFAIHNFDFYPVLGATGLKDLLAQVNSGMVHAAGVRWPHVRGINNGHPFQYSCGVPQIVRDVVNFCPGTNAYYRLPFDQADTFWIQSQANLSDPGCIENCPTHANGYAYDMVAPCGSLLRAARGGRVFWVRETANLQVNKWCCESEDDCAGCNTSCCSANADSCPHNELWIRHQDGSIGRYVHMPQNGVIPEEGDVVLRGEAIGTVGLTGNTSGPHLHFEERTDGTNLALFEALNYSEPSQVFTCFEPTPGVRLRSNNHAP